MKVYLSLFVFLILFNYEFCFSKYKYPNKKNKNKNRKNLIFLSKHTNSKINSSSKSPTFLKVYYESLCPDTIRFFKFSLNDFYKHRNVFFKKNIFSGIQFYPGGLTKYSELSDGKVEFSCMHGYKEYEANKMHSCALNLLPAEKYRGYIFCYMKHILSMYKDNYETGKICGEEVGFDFQIIENCSNKSDGDRYLLEILKARDRLPERVRNAPWVLFNDQFDRERELRVERNLISYTCDEFKLGDLQICKNQDDF